MNWDGIFRTAIRIMPVVFFALILGSCGFGGLGVTSSAGNFGLKVLPETYYDGGAGEIYFETLNSGSDTIMLLKVRNAVNLKAMFVELTFDDTLYSPPVLELSGFPVTGKTPVIPDPPDPNDLQIVGPTISPPRGSCSFQSVDVLHLTKSRSNVAFHGQILINPDETDGFNGKGTLAQLRFSEAGIGGGEPDSASMQKTELSWNSDTRELSWDYINHGDYNQDGVVGVEDLVVVAENFGKITGIDGVSESYLLPHVDFKSKGQIDEDDITPISTYFGASVEGGYNVYFGSGGNTNPPPIFVSATNLIDPPKEYSQYESPPKANLQFSEGTQQTNIDRLLFTYHLEAEVPIPSSFRVAPVDKFGHVGASSRFGPNWPNSRPPGDFGPNVFPVPLDSNGAGRIAVSNFMPGQELALVMVNVHPAYLDAHVLGDGVFPSLPDARYTVVADLVTKGVSSFDASKLDQTSPPGTIFSGRYSGNNDGTPLTSKNVMPGREAGGWGEVPLWATGGVKTTSLIQKGEIRTFEGSSPRNGPPTVLPGTDDPEEDVTELRWPEHYNSQDARLVTIGAHCLIFLSTEISGGHPDTIQFTEAHLNMLAREFDTVIFPNNQDAFGSVQNYQDASIWREIDRSIQLTGDDFGDDNVLISTLPGVLDNSLSEEGKIIIFIHNAEAGRFYSWQKPDPNDPDNPENIDVGSTLYFGGDNFPANTSGWEAMYSVLAHEFQHKLYSDNGLPTRQTNGYSWFNESLSMLALHENGYTINSGNLVDWIVDGQLTEYLTHCNETAVPMDGNNYMSTEAQHGANFLFTLFLFEHYDPGVGRRIYNAAREGITDYTRLIEIGAQTTTVPPGFDGIVGTVDDGLPVVTRDSFENIYVKFALANYIDGFYSDHDEFQWSDTDVFDQRFIYDTIDLKGRVNLVDGILDLPGVKNENFGAAGYPVNDTHRQVIPWAADYITFVNGDGRDLEITIYSDPNFRAFVLPCTYNPDINMVEVLDLAGE